MAATAAEILWVTFENILISFRLETVFRIIAKMQDTLHMPCQIYNIIIFQYLDAKMRLAGLKEKLIFSDIYHILVLSFPKPVRTDACAEFASLHGW